MAVFYLDTSAIVKRYRVEQGTDVLDKLFDQRTPNDRFFTSFLSVLAVTSAALRLSRSLRVGQPAAADQIPEDEGGDAAIGLPGLRARLGLAGGRRGREIVEHADAQAQPQVVARKHVRAAQVEEHEHLGRPHAD